MANLVEIFRTTQSAEAQLKASFLKDRGFRAVVMSADLAAGIGGGSVAVPTRLMVPEGQRDEAIVALEALDAVAEEAVETGPEICPACGASWEPGFDVCWQCQHELEGRDPQESGIEGHPDGA